METGGDGAVGASWPALEKVVESGNIRERFNLLYTARENTLFDELLGPTPYPEALMAERKDRMRRTEEEQERNLRWASGGGSWPPEDVQPPLSDAERRQLAEAARPWVAGSDLYEIALRSPLQKRAFSTGALVWSGTSGTTYELMRIALKMRDQWGTSVDLAALRLLMIGGMVPGRHHTAHEVMLGAQLVFDEIAAEGTAVPEELNYRDGWSRYWHIAPLTEQELRGLSPDGRLPDEYALGLTPPQRTEEAGRPEGATAERAELTSVEVTSPDTSYGDDPGEPSAAPPSASAESEAPDAPVSGPAGSVYPPRAYWNAHGGLSGGAVDASRVWEIVDNTRRVIGLASFSERDWSLRAEAYGRLQGVEKYTQWSRGPGGENVAHEVSMPAFDGAFFFAVHGHPGGGFAAVLPDGETVVKDTEWVRSALEGSGSLRAAGFRNLVILSCGPLVPLSPIDAERLAVGLRALAAATGLSVFQNTGQVAVTPQEGGIPQVHLLEDSEGRPTTWAVAGAYGGDVRRLWTEGSLRLPAGVEPGERAWSVTGWRPTGSPEGVRFGPFYEDG
ncbi:hypothetical protein, partial [Streptomyces sp. NPDC060022]|uniref:hypothetical protein n=1 Tax=Streptomyces sp. NPDC060022 TaxID=3347039 RepID=UPI0036AE0062